MRMKLIQYISFQFKKLRYVHTIKENNYHYYPAVFVIGKPNVGKTSITIPMSERYDLYPIYIRHYVDALSRIEIMKYFLKLTDLNDQIKSRLNFMIDHESYELNNQWSNLIRGRYGVKKRIQLKQLLQSINLDSEKILNEAISNNPDEFKYTHIYLKHHMQTKSSKLIDNKTVHDILEQMVENVQNNLMHKYRGIILDGYPISTDQARILIDTCLKHNFKPVIALEINIPDEELYKNAHIEQDRVNKSALLTLEDREPKYHVDVLKERLRIYHRNIESVKKVLADNDVYVYKLDVPNTCNTSKTEQKVFNMIDKLFSKYFTTN